MFTLGYIGLGLVFSSKNRWKAQPNVQVHDAAGKSACLGMRLFACSRKRESAYMALMDLARFFRVHRVRHALNAECRGFRESVGRVPNPIRGPRLIARFSPYSAFPPLETFRHYRINHTVCNFIAARFPASFSLWGRIRH
jgi:hypothetical protein